MKNANPYLIFNGNAEEAFSFYKSVTGGEYVSLVRFREMQSASEMPEGAGDKLAHVSLSLGNGYTLMGSDTPDSAGNNVTFGDNTFVSIEADSRSEAEHLFNGLSKGGHIKMPLEKTEWAEKFGMCADKFGVQWMISYNGE